MTRFWKVAATLVACCATGCGKPVLRVADASLGDYYTEREFKKLSPEQREEYCNELALQDSLYLDEIREATATLAVAAEHREPLRREADSLLAEAERREQNVRTLRGARGDEASSPTTAVADGTRAWKVRRGDSLWRISDRGDVYGDGTKWRLIYESNRVLVHDPDLIYPGQELNIPR